MAFKCSTCGETYETSDGWSEQKARDEFKKHYGVEYGEIETVALCDDCADALDRWYDNLPPEDKFILDRQQEADIAARKAETRH